MKKFLVLVIVICLSLGLVACNDNSLDTQNNTPNTDDLERETGNTVLGSYNGVDITRDDVGENL